MTENMHPYNTGDKVEYKDPEGEGDKRTVGLVVEESHTPANSFTIRNDSTGAVSQVPSDDVTRSIKGLQRLEKVTHEQGKVEGY